MRFYFILGSIIKGCNRLSCAEGNSGEQRVKCLCLMLLRECPGSGGGG